MGFHNWQASDIETLLAGAWKYGWRALKWEGRGGNQRDSICPLKSQVPPSQNEASTSYRLVLPWLNEIIQEPTKH